MLVLPLDKKILFNFLQSELSCIKLEREWTGILNSQEEYLAATLPSKFETLKKSKGDLNFLLYFLSQSIRLIERNRMVSIFYVSYTPIKRYY